MLSQCAQLHENTPLSSKLSNFATCLHRFSTQFESLLLKITENLPDTERQIENYVDEARNLLKTINREENNHDENNFHAEMNQFHSVLTKALDAFKETETKDQQLFEELKATMAISHKAIAKVGEIFDISENLKVFAINSIVSSQKEGLKGDGYKLISLEFIKRSEEIASGTKSIEILAEKMSLLMTQFFNQIEDYELYTGSKIENVSHQRATLLNESFDRLDLFSQRLNGLLNKIESVKEPCFNIMIELQRQDIIHQQLNHLTESINDITSMKYNDFNSFEIRDEEEQKRAYESLLYYLLENIENQMKRINKDLMSLINSMINHFIKIDAILESVKKDKKEISLTLSGDGQKRENLFTSPQSILNDLLQNISEWKSQKQNLIVTFTDIHDMISEKDEITTSFIPIIESVKNLLLLAKIEKARHNLNMGSNDDNHQISSGELSKLSEINEEMSLTHGLVNDNLEKVSHSYNQQIPLYKSMEKDFSSSLTILDMSERLLKDNFNGIKQISNDLLIGIESYLSYFDDLKSLHDEMDEKVIFCSELRERQKERLDQLGGAFDLEDERFKKGFFEKIVNSLTVADEKDTVSRQYKELHMEESDQSGITLF